MNQIMILKLKAMKTLSIESEQMDKKKKWPVPKEKWDNTKQ
jgi:hypothetical protein